MGFHQMIRPNWQICCVPTVSRVSSLLNSESLYGSATLPAICSFRVYFDHALLSSARYRVPGHSVSECPSSTFLLPPILPSACRKETRRVRDAMGSATASLSNSFVLNRGVHASRRSDYHGLTASSSKIQQAMVRRSSGTHPGGRRGVVTMVRATFF